MHKVKHVDISKHNKFSHDNVSHLRPSEGLFVRCLLPYCKRLAPLWFKGVSSMREKNREEHRRISAAAACQNQNDWDRISNLINEMTPSIETDTVVNLLKKLYKELPADSVLWFIKCWLNFSEAEENEEKCALSRGDVRGRMRRIDGGKGSDKVWRLDTIVGMMYHGMPMSSTDTNIMVHTCDQELCIRPQHLRFKASSVALVVVLKALQQTGYSIVPPSHTESEDRTNQIDEFVDVSGPFTIEELQQYRLEQLKPCEQSMGKLNSSTTDLNLLEAYPLLKDFYPTYSTELKSSLSAHHRQQRNLYLPPGGKHGKDPDRHELSRPPQTTSNSTGSPPNLDHPGLVGCVGNCTTAVTGSSFVQMQPQCHSPPQLDAKPQKLEIAPTPRKMTADGVLNPHQIPCKGRRRRHSHGDQYSGSSSTTSTRARHQLPDNCQPPKLVAENDVAMTTQTLVGFHTSLEPNDTDEAIAIANDDASDMDDNEDNISNDSLSCSSVVRSVVATPSTCAASAVIMTSVAPADNSVSVATCNGTSAATSRPWSRLTNEDSLSGGGLSTQNTVPSNPGSVSGKTTPRQPAKKRLEARTPTNFEPAYPPMASSTGASVASASSSTNGITHMSSQITSSSVSAFKKYHNTFPQMASPILDPESEAEIDHIFDVSSKQQQPEKVGEGPANFNLPLANGSLGGGCLEISDTSGNCHVRNGVNGDDEGHGRESATLTRGSANYTKTMAETGHSLTTPSPLDYLIMAISRQTPSFANPDDSRPNSTQNSGTVYDTSVSCSSTKPVSPSSMFQRKSLSNLASTSNSLHIPGTSTASKSHHQLTCRFTPEQASVLLNAMRSSPHSHNNPEIIDILFSMTQEYGIHLPVRNDTSNGDQTNRADSVLLRQHIYQQLRCGSPATVTESRSSSQTPIGGGHDDLLLGLHQQ